MGEKMVAIHVEVKILDGKVEILPQTINRYRALFPTELLNAYIHIVEGVAKARGWRPGSQKEKEEIHTKEKLSIWTLANL